MQFENLKEIVRAIIPRPLRNSLRSPSRSGEWLWDSMCFTLGVTKELTVPPGCVMVCHPHVYKTVLRSQVVDPDQSDEFRNFVEHCDDRMFLFDIGASFGVFSLATAHFGGRAVAVDPSPMATRLIRIQMALNRCEGNIEVLRASASDSSGVIEMLNSGMFSNGYFKVAKGRPKRELTKTQAITIDEMTTRFGAPTHIKIDVEGYEEAVLRGAKKTLTRFSPLLFLELHNEMVLANGSDPTRVLDELAEIGYEVFGFNGRRLETIAILQKPIVRVVGKRTSRNYPEAG